MGGLGLYAGSESMRKENDSIENGAISAVPVRRRPRRLSEMFAQLARDADGPISLGRIVEAMGARAFAPLLVLFAMINLIPILPPGSTAILGLPLLVFSAQMIMGYRRPWLPASLTKRTMSPETFRKAMEWIVPRLAQIERYVRPRYWPFWRRQGNSVVGAIALVLSISIVLPIPFGNWLPALSTALLGISLLERDGVMLAIGSTVGVVAMAVVGAIFSGAGYMIHAAYAWIF